MRPTESWLSFTVITMHCSVVHPKHFLGHVQRWQMWLRMSSLDCELLEGKHGLIGRSLNLEISF